MEIPLNNQMKSVNRPATPKENLLAGAKILESAMEPHGFAFEFRQAGQGSGGNFAWGEFVRWERRLELHFRYNLGMVNYHFGSLCVGHENFMRELGVWGKNRYPGFSDDPLDSFRDLAHDLQFATDFLSGSGVVLQAAALKEAELGRERQALTMAEDVGDTRTLVQMRDLFREKRYTEVMSLFQSLTFPKRLTKAQQRMVEIAGRARK